MLAVNTSVSVASKGEDSLEKMNKTVIHTRCDGAEEPQYYSRCSITVTVTLGLSNLTGLIS